MSANEDLFYALPGNIRTAIIDAACRSAYQFCDDVDRWVQRGYAANEEAVERYADTAKRIADLYEFLGLPNTLAVGAAAQYAALPIGRAALAEQVAK